MTSTDKDKVDLTALSEDDRKIYLSEKLNRFKLTVMICILYGLIATIMLLIVFFTSWGRKFLYEEMLAFVVTYIIGTIIIVVYLANEVASFKPVVSKASLGYDSDLCPDYWVLKNVPSDDNIFKKDKDDKTFLNLSLNRNQFAYKCELDPNLFDKDEYKRKKGLNESKNDDILYKSFPNKEAVGIKDSNQYKKFQEYNANMMGYTKNDSNVTSNSMFTYRDTNDSEFNFNSQVSVPCNVVYPVYLSVMDAQYQEKNPDEPGNVFRCAYAKSCGINWTDAGCEVTTS